MMRASSSSSQTPVTVTLVPMSPSVKRVLPNRLLLCGDQACGRAEDMAGRAIVALQPDDGGAGEVLVEAQDVVHFRAAPAVDGLVVVADAADIGRALRQQPQPQILGDVGVLVLVDQDVTEAAMVVGQHVGMLTE